MICKVVNHVVHSINACFTILKSERHKVLDFKQRRTGGRTDGRTSQSSSTFFALPFQVSRVLVFSLRQSGDEASRNPVLGEEWQHTSVSAARVGAGTDKEGAQKLIKNVTLLAGYLRIVLQFYYEAIAT